MAKDNFWKIFLLILGGIVLLCITSVSWLKLSYLNRPPDLSLAAAVGASFDPSRNPFYNAEPSDQKADLVSDYLYRDSLPFGFEDWSWGSTVDWRSPEQKYEGSYSIKTTFLEPWSGIRLSGPAIDLSPYQSISLAVRPDSAVGDLYIELYDIYGQGMGKQSIGWYVPGGTLAPDAWNTATIPLINLLPSSRKNQEISGFSISSEHLGNAFIDAVQLSKTVIASTRWVEPAPVLGLGKDPFTGITQIGLPYSLDLNDISSWRLLFGQFEKADTGIHIGPIAKKTNGSMTVFGGGKDWDNYQVDATIYWGMTSTFSLLARFTDDGNFVSCAFSRYGSLVQIYDVKDGVSTLISQTPTLAVSSYEPWKDVQTGATVKDDALSCYANKEKVLTAILPDMPSKGTVGVETWTTNSEDYPHTLESLKVSSY